MGHIDPLIKNLLVVGTPRWMVSNIFNFHPDPWGDDRI